MTQEVLKKMYQLLLTEPHAETVCFKLEAIAREALAQPPLPVQEPVAWNKNIRDSVDSLLAEAGYQPDSSARNALSMMNFDTPPPPVQEPTPWRDMIVVTLAREGINKHRARELADHFVNFTLPPPLPVQEPLEQLRPAEFIQLTKGKEAVTGIPAYCWSEWLNKEQP